MQRWTNRGRSPSFTPGCEPKQFKFRAWASWQMLAKTHVNKRAIKTHYLLMTQTCCRQRDMLVTQALVYCTAPAIPHHVMCSSRCPVPPEDLTYTPCWWQLSPRLWHSSWLPNQELHESARMWELDKLRETSHFHPKRVHLDLSWAFNNF